MLLPLVAMPTFLVGTPLQNSASTQQEFSFASLLQKYLADGTNRRIDFGSWLQRTVWSQHMGQ